MWPDPDDSTPDPEVDEAIERGFADFPAGRLADAQRGTKGRPNKPRCPYRRADRVACWEAGYRKAEHAFFATS